MSVFRTNYPTAKVCRAEVGGDISNEDIFSLLCRNAFDIA